VLILISDIVDADIFIGIIAKGFPTISMIIFCCQNPVRIQVVEAEDQNQEETRCENKEIIIGSGGICLCLGINYLVLNEMKQFE
jgi:hypothetical protein